MNYFWWFLDAHICFDWLYCFLYLFCVSGCRSKFSVPHSNGHSEFLHAHRNYKWPVSTVRAFTAYLLLELSCELSYTLYAVSNRIYFFLFFFLDRENLEWLARATNWAKFTATASLGVIHKVNANAFSEIWPVSAVKMECLKGLTASPSLMCRATKKRRCSWWPHTCPRTPRLARPIRKVVVCTPLDSSMPIMEATSSTISSVSSRMPVTT